MGEEEGQGFLSGGLAGAGTGASIGFMVGGPTGAVVGAGVGFLAGGIVGAEGASAQRRARKRAEKEAERLRIESITREMGKRQQAAETQMAGLRQSNVKVAKNNSVNSSTGFVGNALQTSTSPTTGDF